MIIVKDNSSIKSEKYAIATIGYFDGIHLGHRKIIKELVNQAKIKRGLSVLITFWPHPRTVLDNNTQIKLLLTNREKFKYLEEEGIDIIYLIEFSKSFSKVKADEFVQKYLEEKITIDKLIIGYNHCFGFKREGNFSFLKKNRNKYSFEIQEVKKKEINKDLNISSSNIRKEITIGNIEKSNIMLGYKFFITGKVVKGDGIGKKIGYPTANIFIENNDKIIPGNGVYACLISFNKKELKGMLNIGYRPTVNGKGRRIEIHIFGVNYNLYDENLKIILVRKIRDEKKFTSIENLKIQLKKDEIESIKILKNEKIRN